MIVAEISCTECGCNTCIHNAQEKNGNPIFSCLVQESVCDFRVHWLTRFDAIGPACFTLHRWIEWSYAPLYEMLLAKVPTRTDHHRMYRTLPLGGGLDRISTYSLPGKNMKNNTYGMITRIGSCVAVQAISLVQTVHIGQTGNWHGSALNDCCTSLDIFCSETASL